MFEVTRSALADDDDDGDSPRPLEYQAGLLTT